MILYTATNLPIFWVEGTKCNLTPNKDSTFLFINEGKELKEIDHWCTYLSSISVMFPHVSGEIINKTAFFCENIKQKYSKVLTNQLGSIHYYKLKLKVIRNRKKKNYHNPSISNINRPCRRRNKNGITSLRILHKIQSIWTKLSKREEKEGVD